MSKPQGNRLCREIGHQWDADTVIKDYRRCTRSECRVAQRLVRGTWCDVAMRTRSHAEQQAVQPALFAPDRAIADRTEERRVEQAYLRLLGR